MTSVCLACHSSTASWQRSWRRPRNYAGCHPSCRRSWANDLQQLQEQTADRLPTLLQSQREMADAVLDAVRRRAPLAVFVDAPGGTGKTYTFNAVLTAVRAERRIALAVAYSGIAATLLEGGRTFHSRFKAPLSPQPTSMCAISAQSALAELIRRTDLIVWDEAPMAHRYLLDISSDEPTSSCGMRLPWHIDISWRRWTGP